MKKIITNTIAFSTFICFLHTTTPGFACAKESTPYNTEYCCSQQGYRQDHTPFWSTKNCSSYPGKGTVKESPSGKCTVKTGWTCDL